MAISLVSKRSLTKMKIKYMTYMYTKIKVNSQMKDIKLAMNIKMVKDSQTNSEDFCGNKH